MKMVERIKLNERTLISSLPIARQFIPQTMPPKTGVKIKLSKMAHIGFQRAGAGEGVFFLDIFFAHSSQLNFRIV